MRSNNRMNQVIGKDLSVLLDLPRTELEIMQSWVKSGVPLVSVCCITYNHCRFISQAINSFLMQETDFPFEVVVHDDASTDGTREIVLEYAEKYPNIIKPIIQTENQYSKVGLINPRFVFPKAKGKYLALCEGDDYWTDSTKLSQQVGFLEKNSDYVVVFSDSQPFDENGVLNIDFGGATRDLTSDELMKATPIYTLTTCFRNVLPDIPQDLMSARLGDLVIWSLLGAHGSGKFLPNIKPAAYRVHGGGVFSKKSKTQKYEMLLITNSALYSYYLRIGNKKIASYFKKQIQLSLIETYGATEALSYLKSFFSRLIRLLKMF